MMTAGASTSARRLRRPRLSVLLVAALAGAGCHKLSLSSLEERKAGPEFVHHYNLDRLDDQIFDGKLPVELETSFDDDWKLLGWAVDAATGKPAGGVVLLVDRKLEVPTRYGVSRPDVAAAFHEPSWSNSGFEVLLGERALPKGHHTLSIAILSNDRRAFYRTPAEWPLEVR
jgi:hypothetical protein